jgi:hypothetical protein
MYLRCRLSQSLIVVGLCDFNPFGAALLLSYRFAASSSAASAFEGRGLQTHALR